LQAHYSVAAISLHNLSWYAQLTMPIHSVYSSKSSKIYRCWIVWHQNIRVVVIPSMLAIAFLGSSVDLSLFTYCNLLPSATWIAGTTGAFIEQGKIGETSWSTVLFITGLVISVTVNALVTSLIVFRILKVFWEVKAASNQVLLGATGGTKLRSIIFIIIESGMALFSIQLARVVVTILLAKPGAYNAFQFIGTIHQMLNVIIELIMSACYLTDDMNLTRV
jgi:hypothetical protein